MQSTSRVRPIFPLLRRLRLALLLPRGPSTTTCLLPGGVSCKVKSINVVCGNLFKMLAVGGEQSFNVNVVTAQLGCALWRVNDIMSILRALKVVSKNGKSSYKLLGSSTLPELIQRMQAADPIVRLLHDHPAEHAAAYGGGDEEEEEAAPSAATGQNDIKGGNNLQELTLHIVSLFLQVHTLNTTMSIHQAARSLLVESVWRERPRARSWRNEDESQTPYDIAMCYRRSRWSR